METGLEANERILSKSKTRRLISWWKEKKTRKEPQEHAMRLKLILAVVLKGALPLEECDLKSRAGFFVPPDLPLYCVLRLVKELRVLHSDLFLKVSTTHHSRLEISTFGAFWWNYVPLI